MAHFGRFGRMLVAEAFRRFVGVLWGAVLWCLLAERVKSTGFIARHIAVRLIIARRVSARIKLRSAAIRKRVSVAGTRIVCRRGVTILRAVRVTGIRER